MADREKERSELTTITPHGIACFPHIWEPHRFKGSKNKDGTDKKAEYRIILVLEEGTKMDKLKKIVGKAIINKWGKDGKKLLKRGKLSLPWRDASDYDKYGEPFVEGNIMISAHTTNAPGVVDAKTDPIMEQADFYAGCKARISVYAHAYETMGNMGVTFLLNNVQKTGNGKRLSGRMDAEDEFDAVESDDDDDMDDIL
jgi:Protein of unknown function (DUF2815).